MAECAFGPHAGALRCALGLHAATFQHALVAVWFAFGITGWIIAARRRATSRAWRLELLRIRDEYAAFADAALGLTSAARESVVAVRAQIANALRTAVPAVDGALVYEQRDGSLCCVAAFGERFAYYAGTIAAPDDMTALPARALHAGRRVTLADGGMRALHPCDGAAIAIPLSLEADRRCVLAVASRRRLSADELDRLAALAGHAAPAYLIALDREQDRYDAEYDGLTGLLTPRAFRRNLTALVDGLRFVPSARLGLLFVDTDHFKHWNDRFGHAAGDALLRELANVFRGTVSPRDLVGRNGGDEFCVVFTETDKSTAIERAETLRRRIAQLDVCCLLPAGSNDHVPITASIGVAGYPADASTANDLLERADAAMYHSKLSGRDGVSYCADDGFVRFDSGGGGGRRIEERD